MERIAVEKRTYEALQALEGLIKADQEVMERVAQLHPLLQQFWLLTHLGSQIIYSWFNKNSLFGHVDRLRYAPPRSVYTSICPVPGYGGGYIILGWENKYMEYYSVVVVGVDPDTGKLFATLPLLTRSERAEWVEKVGNCEVTEDEVRSALGFDYHADEEFEWRDGIRIRLQGDLVLAVDRVLADPAEAEKAALARAALYVHDMYDELRIRLEEIREYASTVIGFRKEARQFKAKAAELLAMLGNEDAARKVKKMKIAYSRGAERKAAVLRVFAMIEEALADYARRRGVELEAAYKRIELWLGNHAVVVKAVIPFDGEPLMRALREGDRLGLFNVVLPPQEITLRHPEHGEKTVYLPVPIIGRFTFLLTHS